MPAGADRLRYSTPEHLALERQLVERAVGARDSGVGRGERGRGRGRDRGAADADRRAAARRRVAVPRRPWRGGRRRTGRDREDVHARRCARGVAGGRACRCSASRSRGGRRASCGRAPAFAARASRRCSVISRRVDDAAGALRAGGRRGRDGRRRGELAELLDHVQRASGKLVLVGDDRQLPAIEAGGAFRGLIQRGLAVELGENVRQANVWEREALDHLRAGRSDEALALYGGHEALVVGATADDTRERLVREWLAARGDGDCVMIAQRRADVAELNARAREAARRGAGALGARGAGARRRRVRRRRPGRRQAERPAARRDERPAWGGGGGRRRRPARSSWTAAVGGSSSIARSCRA